MRFRQIPAGTFLMGSPGGEEGRDSDETQHRVKLTRSFLLGETGHFLGARRFFGAGFTPPPEIPRCSFDRLLSTRDRSAASSAIPMLRIKDVLCPLFRPVCHRTVPLVYGLHKKSSDFIASVPKSVLDFSDGRKCLYRSLPKEIHMTAIVSLTNRTTIVMAGDAAGVTKAGSVHLKKEPKVFLRDGYAIGFTTSFRMGQILRYEATLPKPPEEGDLHPFMVTAFIPAVREAFTKHGFSKSMNCGEHSGESHYEEIGQAAGGRFAVGIRGDIFVVEEDFQVGRPTLSYVALGSGSSVAHGALFALPETMPLKERARRALEAAAEHTSSVRPPFTIIEL
jgi:hypothetical protein